MVPTVYEGQGEAQKHAEDARPSQHALEGLARRVPGREGLAPQQIGNLMGQEK
jgi:hypothetical protein